MIFFDDSITKDRADRCVTHHHACDCREYACRQRIEELEEKLKLCELDCMEKAQRLDELQPERIEELEAEAKKDYDDMRRLQGKLISATHEVNQLREERYTIAHYIAEDPPFDTCAGIDLHERAAEYSDKRLEPTPQDYYRAFLDCCRAALLPGRGE